jgi:hypothetical protein
MAKVLQTIHKKLLNIIRRRKLSSAILFLISVPEDYEKTMREVAEESASMGDLKRSIVTSIFATALVWPVLRITNYNETPDGDLSGNYLSPTRSPWFPMDPSQSPGLSKGRGWE